MNRRCAAKAPVPVRIAVSSSIRQACRRFLNRSHRCTSPVRKPGQTIKDRAEEAPAVHPALVATARRAIADLADNIAVLDLHSTIAAIATPPGRGAIGTVRLAGNRSREILSAVVKLSSSPVSRRAYLGQLVDSDGSVIDEVLATCFQAPHSYTGDDVAEISCHGSPVILNHCLRRVVECGARLADPGEFTFRAFLNGRIDLVQAEAVRDLIDSTTLYQAKVAAQQKQGALSSRLSPVKRDLIDLIAMLEAGIDFAEDDIHVAPASEILRRIDGVQTEVDRLLRSYGWGRIVREGFSLAIVGPPNVGKSSLFNALLGHDRAIVTPVAGTTRDLVSESFELNGIPVRLLDTAGIRETSDPVEQLGIARSYAAMADATVTLVVLDASSLHSDADHLHAGASGACLKVANKCDLPGAFVPAGYKAVSALTGEGLEELRNAILVLLNPDRDFLETGFITSLRHKNLLAEANRMLLKARSAVLDFIPHEMLLLDLYGALEPLDGVSGKTGADDILNHIFSTFCIGK